MPTDYLPSNLYQPFRYVTQSIEQQVLNRTKRLRPQIYLHNFLALASYYKLLLEPCFLLFLMLSLAPQPSRDVGHADDLSPFPVTFLRLLFLFISSSYKHTTEDEQVSSELLFKSVCCSIARSSVIKVTPS